MPSSSLWLLEAKPFTTDDRSAEACSVKFWLKPGTVVVGRQGQSELPIEEDKSISRKHAEITVPAAQEGEPHVLLKDRSKYGTWASPASIFADDERVGAEPVRVLHNHMIKFGYKSPFKLYHQDWVLYLSPSQREVADAGDLVALEQAAAATGLPLTDELPEHPGTRVLVLGAAPLRIDGPTLLALQRDYPIVGASWLLEWQQQKVWRNSRPEEAAYPVKLQYSEDGRLKALPSSVPLLRAVEQQPLAGHTLLWLAPTRDAALQEAASLLGADNSDAAASGRAATAAAKAAGAVVVRGGEDDVLPPAYKKLPWTTPELLLAGMLEGRLTAAVHPPAGAPDSTPPGTRGKSRGRRGKQANGSRSTTGGKGKRRSGGRKAAAMVEEDEAEQGSGSETDASEVPSLLWDMQQVLAADTASTAQVVPAQQQQQQQQLKAVPAAVAMLQATDTKAGGRKRHQTEHQQGQLQQQEQLEEEGVRPTPAKRRWQGEPPAAAPSAAAAEPPAARAMQQLPCVMPAAEGWHTVQHLEEEVVAGSGEGKAAGKPAPPGVSAAKKAAAAAAASEEPSPGAADGGREDGQGHEEYGGEFVEPASEDCGSLVAYLPLIVALLPAAARSMSSSNDDTGPNFKAFRKGGGAAAAAAVARPLMAFDEEAYAEDGLMDASAFLKSEAERRRRLQQADELFSANVKAKKATPLSDPVGVTPPKGQVRGQGGKREATAAAAGQQSMLNFLPAAGGGNGRGGGRGRGKGKA